MIRRAKNRQMQKRGIVLLFSVLFWQAPPAFAKNYNYQGSTFDQASALNTGANNYTNGSDDSKNEGVTNAMRALNRLSALDIGGAVNYGYKGYGNYINSQNMDDLNSRSNQRKGSLSSISGGSAGAASSSGPKKLKDMKTDFLYQGEAAEVAKEFEQRSGMSREEFFRQLADAEASGLTWDDPQLMSKVESRYQAFLAKVPNKDFRDKLEKAHSMLTFAKKLDFFQSAADFYQKNRWDGGADTNTAVAHAEAPTTPLSIEPAPPTAAESRSPASEAAPQPIEKSASISAPISPSEGAGMYLGLEGTHGAELNDILANAEGETIFLIVNKRYRKLTPTLMGKAVVLPAK